MTEKGYMTTGNHTVCRRMSMGTGIMKIVQSNTSTSMAHRAHSTTLTGEEMEVDMQPTVQSGGGRME